MKSVKIKKEVWDKIREDLLLTYPKSVIIISWKTKEVLGFTVRTEISYGLGSVYLDFYDEKKRSFFLLKYSEYINGVNQRY